jgi:hypothetical protein
LRPGRRGEHAEQRQNGRKAAQHSQARHEDGTIVSRISAAVIAAFFVSRHAGQALRSEATKFAAGALH